MKEIMTINVYYKYKIFNGETIEMIISSYYCDEISDQGVYIELKRDNSCIGLIFRNSNVIIKKGDVIIYE